MRDIAGEPRRAVADELRANARPEPVGADQRRPLEAPPIHRRNCDPISLVLETGDHGLGHELDRVRALRRLEQNIMQIDAMNDDVWMGETGAERRPGRDARHLCAAERVEHEQCGRRIRRLAHRLADAEAVEDVEDIGAELDAVTDRAEFRRAFEHARAPATLRQGERRREPAEPAANDEDRITHGGQFAYLGHAACGDALTSYPQTRSPDDDSAALFGRRLL